MKGLNGLAVLNVIGPPLSFGFINDIRVASLEMIQRGKERQEIKGKYGEVVIKDTLRKAMIGDVGGHVFHVTVEWGFKTTIITYLVDPRWSVSVVPTDACLFPGLSFPR